MRKYKHSNGISELVVLIALGVVTVTSFVLSNQTTRQQLSKSFAAVQGPPPGGNPSTTPVPTGSPRFNISGDSCSATCVSVFPNSPNYASAQYRGSTSASDCAAAASALRASCQNPSTPPIGGNQPLPTDPADTTPAATPAATGCQTAGYRCNGDVSEYCVAAGVAAMSQVNCQYGCNPTNGRCKVPVSTVPNVAGLKWIRVLEGTIFHCRLAQQSQVGTVYNSYEQCLASFYQNSGNTTTSCRDVDLGYRCGGTDNRYELFCGEVGQTPIRATCDYRCNPTSGRCNTECIPNSCAPDGIYVCNPDGTKSESKYCSGGVICCKNAGEPNQQETQASNEQACLDQSGTVGKCEFPDDLIVNCCTTVNGIRPVPGIPGGQNAQVSVAQCRATGFIGTCTTFHSAVSVPYCNPIKQNECLLRDTPSACIPDLGGGICVSLEDLPMAAHLRKFGGQIQVKFCTGVALSTCTWINILDVPTYFSENIHELLRDMILNDPDQLSFALSEYSFIIFDVDGNPIYPPFTEDQARDLIAQGRLSTDTIDMLTGFWIDRYASYGLPGLVGLYLQGTQFGNDPIAETALLNYITEIDTLRTNNVDFFVYYTALQQCTDYWGGFGLCQFAGQLFTVANYVFGELAGAAVNRLLTNGLVLPYRPHDLFNPSYYRGLGFNTIPLTSAFYSPSLANATSFTPAQRQLLIDLIERNGYTVNDVIANRALLQELLDREGSSFLQSLGLTTLPENYLYRGNGYLSLADDALFSNNTYYSFGSQQVQVQTISSSHPYFQSVSNNMMDLTDEILSSLDTNPELYSLIGRLSRDEQEAYVMNLLIGGTYQYDALAPALTPASPLLGTAADEIGGNVAELANACMSQPIAVCRHQAVIAQPIVQNTLDPNARVISYDIFDAAGNQVPGHALLELPESGLIMDVTNGQVYNSVDEMLSNAVLEPGQYVDPQYVYIQVPTEAGTAYQSYYSPFRNQ